MIPSKPLTVIPHPQPQRRVRRQWMTVAAGFQCNDGIVICADSQESSGDYKLPVEKLLAKSDPWTEVVIAGSGTGPLVDMAAQRIARALLGGYGDYRVIEDRVGDVLTGLYETEFRLYPTVSSPDDNFIELIIGVKLKKAEVPILLHCAATAIVHVENYAVIGSGRAVQYQTHILYGKRMEVSSGVLLAIRLLAVAKQVLSSVGGRGRIATLHVGNTQMGEAHPWEIAETEKAFQKFSVEADKLLLDFADLKITDAIFIQKLQDFVGWTVWLRNEHKKGAEGFEQLMHRLTEGSTPSDSQTSTG